MDRLTPEQRSAQMSRIRGTNTRPELVVRRLVHHAGWSTTPGSDSDCTGGFLPWHRPRPDVTTRMYGYPEESSRDVRISSFPGNGRSSSSMAVSGTNTAVGPDGTHQQPMRSSGPGSSRRTGNAMHVTTRNSMNWAGVSWMSGNAN